MSCVTHSLSLIMFHDVFQCEILAKGIRLNWNYSSVIIHLLQRLGVDCWLVGWIWIHSAVN